MMMNSDASTLPVMLGGSTRSVPIGLIVHLKGDGNYTRVYLSSGQTGLLTKNLRQAWAMVPRFWRLHKSYLVNPDYIDGRTATGCLRLHSGLMLPVARHRRKDVAGLLRTSHPVN